MPARLSLRVPVAAAVAGALVALLDALVAAWGARTSVAAGDSLRLGLSVAVLAAGPAALVGLAEAVLLGGLVGARPLAWLRSLRREPDADRRAASWVLAGAVGLALYAGALGWWSPRLFALPEDAPARAGALALRGLVLAAVAVGLLVAVALAAWTAARPVAWLLGRLPASWRDRVPFTWAAFGFAGLVGLAAVLWGVATRADLLHALDGGLLAWAALFFTVQVALVRVRRRRIVLSVLAGLLLTSTPVVVLTFDDPALLSLAYARTTVGKRAVSLWRRALDFDGDGYARLLGGGDCDDADATVHPGAPDVPGNGRDEDCSGADALGVAAAPPAAAPRRPTGTNILWITIDTLRAGHLGAYGYARPTSPSLDAFARTAVVFERAYAASNHTPRSIPALLTGLYPSRLGWKKRSNYPPLADETRTIAEDLKAAGYRTAGVFSHWYFHRRRNLHRGFDVWDLGAAPATDDGSAVTAPEVTRRARRHLRRLARGPSPFFLWVHYYEPHYPYVEHPGTPRFGARMKDRYDGEIRFVDAHVGELLRELEATGAAGTTAVVVTSDHGEAFGEHGKHWHGHALYDEQVLVPLLLRAPGVAAGRVKTAVSAVDVVPTVLDLAGLPARATLSGRSLVPLARGEAQGQRPVFVELLSYPNFPRSMRAVVVGGLKLIHDISDNRFELYDLERDPGETEDLFPLRPAEAERLKLVLGAFVDGGPLAALP